MKNLTPHKPTSKPGGGGRMGQIEKDLTPHKHTSKPGGGGRMGKDIGPDSS